MKNEMEMTMRIRMIITTLMLMASMVMSAQVKTVLTDEYKNEVREKLQLDYTMPDYSVSKIDAKVMGERLAKILTRINQVYWQDVYLSLLSMIQTCQIDGMSYGIIKHLKLKNVSKHGDEIRIEYKTSLNSNNLNLKSAVLVFSFIDGVSEDSAVNDFFSQICRYIKE